MIMIGQSKTGTALTSYLPQVHSFAPLFTSLCKLSKYAGGKLFS
jgi:hypothetical protein